MPPLDEAATSDRFAVSVSALTNNCISMFKALKHLLLEENTETIENRLIDFRLWADGVRAMAKPGASLDSRFHSRPDNLALVKGILIILTDFLGEYINLAHQRQSISEAIINVDSSIMNLAMIGMAIRQTRRASRSRRADQSFRPKDHQELAKHLQCVILLRPSKTQPALSVPENPDDLTSESRKAFSARLSALDPSKLSVLQRRLIEANLRRRHRFLLAQKRSQRPAQVGTRQEVLDAWDIADNSAGLGAPNSTLGSTETDMIPRTTNLPKHLLRGPPSIAVLSTASTAEGTLQYRPAQRHRIPAIARSQISFIAADTEFPKPPAHPKAQLVCKYPYYCQSLPTHIFESPTEWKKHLIEDLYPYTCIAEHCPTPQLLFASRKAWEAHVEKDHPVQWRCALCEEEPTVFRLVQNIEDHISMDHPDELSSYPLPTLVSWSEVQRMGIRSCPLCPSYGPEDSPELVDHVVRHSYEFALRSLPWPHTPREILNGPIGTYTLPACEEKADRLKRWIENSEHGTESLSLHLSASFDLVLHDAPGEHESESEQQDYFVDNAYFDDQDIAGSSQQQSQVPSEHSSFGSSKSVSEQPFDQDPREEAEELEIMETRKVMLGVDHPSTLESMDNLASIYMNQGRWEEAESLWVQVLETSKRILGEDHFGILKSMDNLAWIYMKQGRWKEAEELEVQVIKARKRILGEDHPSTLESMANLASIYRNQGRDKEAEELEEQVMELSKTKP
ncbi:hypothetical protein QBC42DRAFT_278636 [Cladorrhinum samala]|uniref:Kinesin light chain n=1 Tax=Cladorrhinum samala TaxID=585594 RepID=A0AAV9HA31_9PEZI|nr:hypothetical protein QBC42DRAFT_278636 [Cladorrhinum samala]